MADTQTIGETRVRSSFNPSDNSNVGNIKSNTAALITLVDSLKVKDPRLAALAMTAYEEAAMWAVKLVTSPDAPAAPAPVEEDATASEASTAAPADEETKEPAP